MPVHLSNTKSYMYFVKLTAKLIFDSSNFKIGLLEIESFTYKFQLVRQLQLLTLLL